MYNRKTITQFITDAVSVHGTKYDYSKFIYTNWQTKSIIICRLHGEFLQTPNSHLRGEGCYECGLKSLNILQQ